MLGASPLVLQVDTAAGDLELLQQQLTELSGNVSMVSDKAPGQLSYSTGSWHISSQQ